jgi:hypothetical protein
VSLSIDHERRRFVEERAQRRGCFIRQRCFIKCAVHQFHPAVPGALIDFERRMALSKTGMASLLDVTIGAAEAANQEIAKPFFGAGHIVRWIHRAENVVSRDLRVKRADEAGEAFVADGGEDLMIGDAHCVYPGLKAPGLQNLPQG